MKLDRVLYSLILFLLIITAISCGGGGSPFTLEPSSQPDAVPVLNLNTHGVSFDGSSLAPNTAIITVPPGSSHVVKFDPTVNFQPASFDSFDVKCSSGSWSVDGDQVGNAVSTDENVLEWTAPLTEGDVQILFSQSGSGTTPQLGMMVRVSTDWHLSPRPPAPIEHVVSWIDPVTSIEADAAAGEILVRLKDSAPLTSIYSFESGQAMNLLERVSETQPIFRMRFDDGVDLRQVMSDILNDPNVETVEPNYLAFIAVVPTDPDYGYKHEFPKIDAPQAWDIATGSADVWVAVVDTGADRDHPDLAANILPGADFITGGDGLGGETPGDGIDNNQDGMVDQNVGHGSHVSGIIASVANNGVGACGIAYNTKILPLRIFPSNGDTGATFSSIIEAIEYATNVENVKVISMSIGSTYESSLLQSAINSAWSAGKVVVAAACNSNTDLPYYPAAHNNVISVAALNKDGGKASFSNYGAWVDISAYGTGIYSTYFNDGYAYMSGTSMACPLVSGCIALLFSYEVGLSNDRVVDAITGNTDDVNALNPSYTGLLGSGIVNPNLALTGITHSQPGDVGDADGGGDDSGAGVVPGPATDI